MLRAHKDKSQSKKARSDRAKVRSIQTGNNHYDLSPENIGFCHQQIRSSKSSFIMRWGKLSIHRVLSSVGNVFAAYDSSIKLISFFIPKDKGLAIAKGSKSAAWGRYKKSGVLLLPPLPKKAPLRVHEMIAAAEGDDEIMTMAGDESPLTKSEVRVMKAGVTTRIKFLQDMFDKKMDNPQLHWDEITTLGTRIEELEAMIASMPEGVPDPIAAVPDDPHAERRHAVITELNHIEQEMITCDIRELVEKSNRLSALKKELFQLIPNEGVMDRREALHQATTRLRDEMKAFQSVREYGKGADLPADRKRMAGLRHRLRTLLSMHQALFGTSYFMDPPPEPMEGREVANEPPHLTGMSKVAARFSYVNRRIHDIDHQLKTAEASESNRLHHNRLILVGELGTMPTKAECASLSDEEIDRILSLRRLIALRGYIKWFMEKHNVTAEGPAKEHLIEVHEKFDDLAFDYNDRYPESLKEHNGPSSTTESLSGTRH